MRSCDWLKLPKFSLRNIKRLRLENLGIFSQSQPRIHFVKSQYFELENIAIEQSFVAVYRERRRQLL
jgi:hypothetical protein